MPFLLRSTHCRELEQQEERYEQRIRELLSDIDNLTEQHDRQLAQQRYLYEEQIETLRELVRDLTERQERFDDRLLERTLPPPYVPTPSDTSPQRILTDPAGTGLVVSYEDDDDPYATDEEPE